MSKLMILEVCPRTDTRFGSETGFEAKNGSLLQYTKKRLSKMVENPKISNLVLLPPPLPPMLLPPPLPAAPSPATATAARRRVRCCRGLSLPL